MALSPFDRLMRRCAKRFSPRQTGIKVVYIRGDVKGHRRKRFPIDGVFDREYEAVALESDGTPITSLSTQLSIHRNALPFAPKRGDSVRVGDEVFFVSEAQSDSEYGLVLVLRK